MVLQKGDRVINEKKCTKCNQEYPATLEHFYKQGKTLSSWCKVCYKTKQLKYYHDNRESYLPKKREWRRKNKDMVNERAKKWKIDNQERWKEYYSDWQKSELGKEFSKGYHSIRNSNKKHTFNIIEWSECKSFFENSCAYCGLLEKEHKHMFNQQLHKDHYDPEGSNGIDNCVPACRVCNSFKHDTHGEVWY
ncbi:HNH endonuclease [Paenibacillus polymyxa]|uniref:HNH endonuclease n=1 Tax=Paenibacillus polymyxa TaxID=1406 RepID=UPI0009B790E8|nr:HNH endonuclease [Paenibacillus polymyxa]